MPAFSVVALVCSLAICSTPAVSDEEEGPPAPKLEVPRCSSGETTDETALMRAIEKLGLKFESVHGHPGGGSEITYAGHGQWVRLLGDGGLACAIAAGRDEETSA